MIPGIESFGKVEQCQQVGEEFHVMITNGFDIGMRNTNELLKLIIAAKPEYPIVKLAKTDNNLFHLILKK